MIFRINGHTHVTQLLILILETSAGKKQRLEHWRCFHRITYKQRGPDLYQEIRERVRGPHAI